MNISAQALVSGNIGMRYFAKLKKGGVSQVTHLAMYAQSTDALLSENGGEIALMVNDTGHDVIATLVTTGRTQGVAYNGDFVKDLSDNGNASGVVRKLTPLYVETDGGLYQVSLVTANEGIANAHMAEHNEVSLIDTIAPTEETPELYVVATTKRAH